MPENSVRENQAFEFFAILREAWHLTKGAKSAIWNPMLVIFILSIVSLLGMLLGAWGFISLGVPIVLICLYCFFGFLAGLIKTIFACTQKHDVSLSTNNHDFSRVFPLLFTCLFAIILIELPQMISYVFSPPTVNNMQYVINISFFSVLSFIYALVIMTFLYLSPALAVDKISSPFEAIQVSFKTVRPYWLKILGILFVQLLVFSLGFSAISFMLMWSFGVSAVVGAHARFILELITIVAVVVLIAQIWLFPFICLVFGVVYCKLMDIPISPPIAEMLPNVLPQKELPPKELPSVGVPLLISAALALLSCLLVFRGENAIEVMSFYMLIFLATVFSFTRNSSELPKLFLQVASIVGCIAIPVLVFMALLVCTTVNGLLGLAVITFPVLLGISIAWGWSCYARKKYTHALLFTLLPLYCFSYLPLIFSGQFLR